jgi:hypothetical protein
MTNAVFKIQKNGLRLIKGVKNRVCCRSLFGDYKILTITSKSIEPYFFPCKQMKRGRLSSVEMWRGQSCAVVNIFPPAESFSRCSRPMSEDV